MLLAVTIAIASPAADCEPADASDLTEALSKAEVGFTARDKAAVAAYVERVNAIVPCLSKPLAPVDVARLYTVLGLNSFLLHDRDATQRYFESARTLKPDATLPDTTLPENHPLRALFDGVSTVSAGERALQRPSSGWIVVDGTPRSQPPVDRTWLFQRLDDSGTVLETRLIEPGAALPDYPSGRPITVSVLAGFWSFPNASEDALIGSLVGQVGIPLSRTMDLDLALTPGAYPVGWVPAARAGVRIWLSDTELAPFIGGVAEVSFHEDGGFLEDDIGFVVRPAFGIPLGIRMDLGPVGLDVEVVNTAGQAHDAPDLRIFTRVGVGVSFSL